MKDNFILNKTEIERAELNEKIEKIRSFLDGKNRKLISPIQELLLTLQLDSMKTYFDILTYRIICLRNEYSIIKKGCDKKMCKDKRNKKIYYQLSDEMKKSHYFIIKINENAALSILKTMGSDNFCIEQLKVKQAIETILDSYQQEKEKNKNLIKQLQDLSKQLREKEQENIKMRSNFLLSLNDFILKDKIRAFIKKETFEGRYSFDLISAKRLQKLLSED